jgi:hypothetical protein
MWMRTQRSEMGPRQRSSPVTSRPGASPTSWSAKATSDRQTSQASATRSGVGGGAVEVAVGVGAGGEAGWGVLAGHHLAEPAALDVGQVADQAEQRHRRGVDGAPGQVGGLEAGALQLQGAALPAQERQQGGALVDLGRWVDPRVGVGVDEHVEGHAGTLGDPRRGHHAFPDGGRPPR